jgi:hypothetical protein
MPEEVTEPLVYADGLCVNIDSGMYLGGPGFYISCLGWNDRPWELGVGIFRPTPNS